jgi:argininosuccinate lyase
MTESKEKKAWGGVFTEETDSNVELFTESISFDKTLYDADIRGSVAHARMLKDVGLLTADEFSQIESGLSEIRSEIENGTFKYDIKKEDIHLHIESALTDKIGDAGRKLHTARSRNDQVITDFRLWIRDSLDRVNVLLIDLQKAFIGKCDKDFDVILPAYTHTQRAQPVLAPHYYLAYCEKFERDRQRILDCRKRVNVMGLGCAAVAGTSIPIDRNKTAEYLGFEAIAPNSIDVSSDRDFVLETVFCLLEISLHLSTLAEEWIWWFTSEFKFITIPQKFCTGSSIMPQKINPDVLELIRGKTARISGNLQALILLVKGLPLAYNRDLQEDKPPVFDSFNTLEAVLPLAAQIVAGTELNRKIIAERLEFGYLDATTLMEHLIKQGVPQRTAHGIVGRIVRFAMDKNVPLAKLTLSEFQAVYAGFDESVYTVLGAANAVSAMQSYGSTSPKEVRKQVDRWKERVSV